MYKIIILLVIISFYMFRYILDKELKKDASFLFASIIVFLIPFGIGFLTFPEPPKFRTGAFNRAISIEVIFFLSLLLFLYQIIRNKNLISKYTINLTTLAIVGLFVISLVNPGNITKISSMLLIIRTLMMFFIFYLLTISFSRQTILKGIYDAFSCHIILQFTLAICYPVLGIVQVLDIFQTSLVDVAIHGRGGRLSAVGIFPHPGDFGLFISFVCCYFLAHYLTGVRKKKSLIFFLLAVAALILSTSRSALLSAIPALSLIYIIYRNPKASIFNLKNITIFLFLTIAVMFVILQYTNLGQSFQGQNFEEMSEARFVHWRAGYEGFIRNPVIGVGINSHLSYLRDELKILWGFYAEHPIHNIHIQVLVETGIIGIVFWFFLFISTMIKSQKQMVVSNNQSFRGFNLFLIGFLVSFFIYGFFGWAPFKTSSFDLFLLFIYLAYKYREKPQETIQHSSV